MRHRGVGQQSKDIQTAADGDPDVMAIRALMQETARTGTGRDEAVAAAHRQERRPSVVANAPRVDRAVQPTTAAGMPAKAPQAETSGAAGADTFSSKVWRVVKNYRPNRKRILITSLVLLLLLRPMLVVGWIIFAGFILLLSYLFAGPDRFWRGVVSAYRFGARRWPAQARLWRVRAYLFAKRWDRLLQYAPQRLADALRSPDLNAIAKADARHEAAMSRRLGDLSGTSRAE